MSKNFTNKKKSLNTKVDFGNVEPFVAKEVAHVEPISTSTPVNNEKKVYICICNDDSEWTTGTLTQIENWINQKQYDENNTLYLLELKSDVAVDFKVNRKTTISLI